jgi:DNA-binding NarL/FixJ family response regulator
MFRPLSSLSSDASLHRSAYPSGQFSGPSGEHHRMALLALSHTPLEDQLYRAMLAEVAGRENSSGAFSIRGLTELTGIHSPSTIRRTLSGLLDKQSIQRTRNERGAAEAEGFTYRIFRPEEIFQRRIEAGLPPYPKEIEAYERNAGFKEAIQRVVSKSNLSRREAQVALACAEGLTNPEIGRRLFICEQTVKFHLRNIFVKFGVRRRTELISRLMFEDARASAAGIERAEE